MTNRLKFETSPYLLQHADNPVDWQPWDDRALNQAVAEDKPILLSIGYAACHWCHVMEHESFENQGIAEMMNKHFVCIKVDREERPDLDRIYQLAHQMLTQRPGGWPLTLALTPSGHAPFFAGTYFPPQPRQGMPGFLYLLEKVSTHYRQNHISLQNYHATFTAALNRLNPQRSSRPESVDHVIENSISTLARQFDETFGGFGDAPKFPHPTQLWLLLTALSEPDHASAHTAETMIGKTLDAMGNGGLFDHLGGGFFRYSVDRQWQIPHFEKMLYDNAQLLQLYALAYAAFQKDRYREIADGVARWIIEEMQLPAGGFAATLDADSEGEEGKYYVWSETDLRAILSEQEYDLAENVYGLYGDANFEGGWHLNLNPQTDWTLLQRQPELRQQIAALNQHLLAIRQQRIAPNLDNKVISAWNGLAIAGLCTAADILEQDQYLHAAYQSLGFVRTVMWRQGRLYAVAVDSEARLPGYLDDYAFMLVAAVKLLQADWRTETLTFAMALAEALLEHFEDSDGGFFFTAHDHEKLLYRPKTAADDAIPSGNGAAALGLGLLGRLLGEPRYLNSAQRTLDIFAQDSPSVSALLSIAHVCNTTAAASVIIRGNKQELTAWRLALREAGMFATVLNPAAAQGIYFIGSEAGARLPGSLSEKKRTPGGCAYICYGDRCLEPIASPETLIQALQNR